MHRLQAEHLSILGFLEKSIINMRSTILAIALAATVCTPAKYVVACALNRYLLPLVILSAHICMFFPVLSCAQAEGASMGPQRPGWKDHYFRVHPSARASAAKIHAARKRALEEHKSKQEEQRKLMTGMCAQSPQLQNS